MAPKRSLARPTDCIPLPAAPSRSPRRRPPPASFAHALAHTRRAAPLAPPSRTCLAEVASAPEERDDALVIELKACARERARRRGSVIRWRRPHTTMTGRRDRWRTASRGLAAPWKCAHSHSNQQQPTNRRLLFTPTRNSIVRSRFTSCSSSPARARRQRRRPKLDLCWN